MNWAKKASDRSRSSSPKRRDRPSEQEGTSRAASNAGFSDDSEPSCWLRYNCMTRIKVRCVAMHPGKPWVAVGDDYGYISLHDYERNVVLWKVQAEMAIESGTHSVNKALPLRLICFCDTESSFWKEKAENDKFLGKETNLGPRQISLRVNSAKEELVDKPSYIVAVSATAVIMANYRSRLVKEARGVDSRTICGLDVAPGGSAPVVAMACSDGTIKILDPAQERVVRTFKYGKHKSMNHVICYMRKSTSEQSADRNGTVGIAASCADGQLYSWGWEEPETPVSLQAQSEVLDMSYAPSQHRLITIHSDKSIAIWQLSPSLQEISRSKPGGKQALAFAQVGSLQLPYPFGLSCAAVTAKDSRLFLVSGCTTGRMNPVLLSEIPPLCRLGDKKVAKGFKVYSIRTHPVIPDTVAICSNCGFAVIRLVTPRIQQIAYQEAPPSAKIKGKVFFLQQGAGGLDLFSVDLLAPRPGQSSRALSIAPKKICQVTLRGSSQLKISARGRFLAVVSLESKEYIIFAVRDQNAEKVESGTCGAVAWDTESERCAILPTTSTVEGQNFRILKWPSEDNSPVKHDLHIEGLSGVTKIEGGPMICAYTARQGKTPMCQFVDWVGTKKSRPLPMPKEVVWAEQSPACAMLYESHVSILVHQNGQLHPFRSIRMAVESGLWSQGVFYCSTRDAVHAFFPAVGEMLTTTVATFESSTVQEISGDDVHQKLLPFSLPRPIGMLRVLGVVNSAEQGFKGSLLTACEGGETNLFYLDLNAPSMLFKRLLSTGSVGPAWTAASEDKTRQSEYCMERLRQPPSGKSLLILRMWRLAGRRQTSRAGKWIGTSAPSLEFIN